MLTATFRRTRRFTLAFLAISTALAVSATSAVAAQPMPDLGGRKVVAVTENAYPPLNMLNTRTGQGEGWEYDAFNEIARRLNLKVEWRISSWDALIESVRDGQFDVGMDGIAINDARRTQIDFSAPYMRSELVMLVRAGEARFADPAAFRANRKLLAGAQPGTTSFYATGRELLGVSGTDPRMKLFETFGASVQALKAGDVDVVLSDRVSAQGYMVQYPGVFKRVGPALAGEDYGFALRKGSPLKGPIDAALQQMAADGTLDKINRRWFAEPVARP